MSITSEGIHRGNVLIVDDTVMNLQVLNGMLSQQGYKVRPATSGKLALQAAQADPPDIILLDITMPEMDGFEVCQRLKSDEKLMGIPVIFISALTETLDKVKAFSLGGVDYITKPFQLEEVQARVETHMRLRQLQIELEEHNQHLEGLVEAQVKEICDSQMATILAIAKLSESRDEETGKHLERTQTFCRLLAAKLSETPRYRTSITPTYISTIFHASPLHDIGKVGIADSILLKRGRLSGAEFEEMKRHPLIGAETLQAVRKRYPKNAFINMGIAIARSHHEKWDGSGYPDGLSGEDIPLAARIMSVADVYDALHSNRCYRAALTHERTCEMIYVDSGVRFDPTLVDAFRELQDQFREVQETLG